MFGINLKIIKDYLDLHLKCDVLVDVFKKTRTNSIKNDAFCPSNYLSAPGLGQDAMLKMTKNKYELIPNPGLFIFFEKGARGQIS